MKYELHELHELNTIKYEKNVLIRIIRINIAKQITINIAAG
jgi:hypothetical protein